jgi:hypothetical protein
MTSIQPQTTLLSLRAVAFAAMLLQNGPDGFFEINRLLSRHNVSRRQQDQNWQKSIHQIDVPEWAG